MEGVFLFVIILIAILAFAAWKGLSGDPAKALAALLSKLWAGSDSLFLRLNNVLTKPAGSESGSGPDVVYGAGSEFGSNGRSRLQLCAGNRRRALNV